MHLTILLYSSYFLVFTMYSLLFCIKWFCCCMKSKTFYLPRMFGVCVNFKIRVFQWSVLNWCWETEGRKTATIIYCWQQQQRVHSRTAQLSDDLRGPTCIADLDSGALALTNAQNRPALLQLNRPLGTVVLLGTGSPGRPPRCSHSS